MLLICIQQFKKFVEPIKSNYRIAVSIVFLDVYHIYYCILKAFRYTFTMVSNKRVVLPLKDRMQVIQDSESRLIQVKEAKKYKCG